VTAELIEAGAIPADVVRDGRWIHEGAPLCRFRSGLDGLLLSRPLLENMVRKRVLALPNVNALEVTRVTGLLTKDRDRRIAGVQLAGRGASQLWGDLIVDASGRGSSTPEWLAAAGYDRPEVERIDVALGYTTRLFRRRPDHLGGDLIAVIPPKARRKQGGVMVARENDR
jgi:hypothetical protein